MCDTATTADCGSECDSDGADVNTFRDEGGHLFLSCKLHSGPGHALFDNVDVMLPFTVGELDLEQRDEMKSVYTGPPTTEGQSIQWRQSTQNGLSQKARSNGTTTFSGSGETQMSQPHLDDVTREELGSFTPAMRTP